MQPWMVLVLWLVYLALSANFELRNVVLGLLIAGGITALVHPAPYRIEPQRVPAAVWAAVRYVFVVAKDVLEGGLQVARLTLDPKLPIHPAIIAIPSGTESEMATALSAHAITLSPGAMVMEIGDHGAMYTHTLDVTVPDEVYFEMQARRRDLLMEIASEP
ncbi:MAG: Na+/H+ antiporter subunit E [Caldilineales bacterium]|nr:Na+/H+ antiporter subunit E [Caldilineales bacterium]MDW8318162.1 Na+/H+ antiporter subunit E [Anaerolineae bacterium]